MAVLLAFILTSLGLIVVLQLNVIAIGRTSKSKFRLISSKRFVLPPPITLHKPTYVLYDLPVSLSSELLLSSRYHEYSRLKLGSSSNL